MQYFGPQCSCSIHVQPSSWHGCCWPRTRSHFPLTTESVDSLFLQLRLDFKGKLQTDAKRRHSLTTALMHDWNVLLSQGWMPNSLWMQASRPPFSDAPNVCFQTCICALCWSAPWACCPSSCSLWVSRASTFTDGTEKKVQSLVGLASLNRGITQPFEVNLRLSLGFAPSQPAICWSSVQKAGTVNTPPK